MRLDENNFPHVDYDHCKGCMICYQECPTDAITHGHDFEMASFNTSTLIRRKEDMLVALPTPAPGVVLKDEPVGRH